MVTKREALQEFGCGRLILAKIHMVTKQLMKWKSLYRCLILAKIHMVTKQVPAF